MADLCLLRVRAWQLQSATLMFHPEKLLLPWTFFQWNICVRRISLSAGFVFDVNTYDVVMESLSGNKVMTVLGLEVGKVIAVVPIVEGCDSAGFDPESGLAFASNGEVALTIVYESSPGRFEVAETVPAQAGGRTKTIDPKTPDVYLPTAQFAPLSA